MPVTQYMGGSGIVMQQLERALPGAYNFVLVFALMIGVLFAFRITRFQENPKEVFLYFGMMGLASFVLFGNMATFLGVMVIIGCMWIYVRYNWAAAEHVPSSGKKMAEAYFPELMSKLEALEAAEKKRSSKESAFEKTVVEEEEMEAALVAAEADLGNKIKSVIESEKEAAEKEQEIVKAIVGYTDNIEKQLSGYSSMALIDQAGKNLVISYAQNIGGLIKQFAATINSWLGKVTVSINGFNDSIITMNDIVNHAKKLSGGLSETEKRLSKELGKDLIDQVVAKLNSMKSQLRSLESQLASMKSDDATKPFIEQQISDLRQEITTLEGELAKLNDMKSQLSSAIASVGLNIADIQSNINKVLSSEKKLKTHETAFTSVLGDLSLKDFSVAVERMNDSISRLDLGVNMAEDVPISMTINVGNVFREILKDQKTALKFYQELPGLIDDLITDLTYSSLIERDFQSLSVAVASIDKGYGELKGAVSAILGVVSADDQEFAQLVSTFNSVASDRSLFDATASTLAVLRKDRPIADEALVNIQKNIVYFETSEKHILEVLTRVLNSIVKNKVRVDADFQKKADIFAKDMAKVQEEEQKRRAATA